MMTRQSNSGDTGIFSRRRLRIVGLAACSVMVIGACSSDSAQPSTSSPQIDSIQLTSPSQLSTDDFVEIDDESWQSEQSEAEVSLADIAELVPAPPPLTDQQMQPGSRVALQVESLREVQELLEDRDVSLTVAALDVGGEGFVYVDGDVAEELLDQGIVTSEDLSPTVEMSTQAGGFGGPLVTGSQVDPPWGLDVIDSRQTFGGDGRYVWQSSGAGVIVYVVDDGVQPVDGMKVIRGVSVVNGPFLSDCGRHGTHVAGTVGGKTYGVAKNVGISSIRVLDCSGRGTDETVIRGLQWILNNHPGGAAVINMSLGGLRSAPLDMMVDLMRSRGFVVVAAAGNDGLDACQFSPASSATFAVGAVDDRGARAYFSNVGRCVDVFAPGVSILSTTPGGPEIFSGTSMAAPHVSGVVARLLSSGKGSSDLLSLAKKDWVIGAGSGSPNLMLNWAESVSYSTPKDLQHDFRFLSGESTARVRITWAASLDSDGNEPPTYAIDLRPSGSSSSSWKRALTSDGSRAIEVSGLNGTWDFRVGAYDGGLVGEWANGSFAVPPPGVSTTTTPLPSNAPTSSTDPLITKPSPSSSSSTTAAPVLSVVSEFYSPSSLTLTDSLGSNAVRWTVRVRDSGGRLPASGVGARLCPVGASWPDGSGCTGATATGSGSGFERTYTFLFLISPDQVGGRWRGRIFGPISSVGDVVSSRWIDIESVPNSTSTSLVSTTTRTTTRPPSSTTTTTRPPTLSVESESLSRTSMVLQSNISQNGVTWTIRVRDPFGGRLGGRTVGARLCPVDSAWPDGPGCTGAISNGTGHRYDMTFTFLFLISPDAPSGSWRGRMSAVPDAPDIIGATRVQVSRQTPTTSTSSTTDAPSTTAAPVMSIVSEFYSPSSLTLTDSLGSNAVRWTVRVRDSGGRLPASGVGARLCPVGASWPDGSGCTGATATGSGSGFERTYTFLFLISPDQVGGQWRGRIFGPISGEPDVISERFVEVTAR